MLTSCLLRSRILPLTLLQPTFVEADADIMRICVKLVITLVFKASKRRILFGEVQGGSKLAASIEDLYRRLDMDFKQEKRDTQELMKAFVSKLHAFEIQHIEKDGYVQFIHLISQIVMMTSEPKNCRDERIKILPTQDILRQLIQSWSESMDEDKIRELIDGSSSTNQLQQLGQKLMQGNSRTKGNNLAATFTNSQESRNGSKNAQQPAETVQTQSNQAGENVSNNSAIKMLLYKFFFFNYVFQVTAPDLMESLKTGEHKDFMKYLGRDFPEILKPHEMTQAQREQFKATQD